VALEDVLEGQGVPEPIWTVVAHYGLVGYDPSEPEYVVYARMLEGKCVTCTRPLGEQTLLFMGGNGVAGLFCCGQCYTDMIVMGWMMEHYDDMSQQIQFRASQGAADVADEE
jgi:hypothetical protein